MDLVTKRPSLRVWISRTSWICQVKVELWKFVATPEDYSSLKPPEVASHSLGCFVCGLLCGCVIISNGIMFLLSTIHCKTTQLVNKTVMNFSELYFSQCLLKRQKLLLRVFMLFKYNWLFTTSFVFFFLNGQLSLHFCCSFVLSENSKTLFFFLIVLRNKLTAFLIEKITSNIVFWRFQCYWQVGRNSNDVREKPHFFLNFSLIVWVHFYGITFFQVTLFYLILLFKLVKSESVSHSVMSDSLRSHGL